jgi:DNA invertase Pin-like site-specific DNA recombinase
MLIGYARVSTDNQNLQLQEDELRKAGCERIFSDVVSGSKTERTGLRDALNVCRRDDVLVVWKMDRLGRSLKHLIETIVDLQSKGIGFRSLTQNLDTTTAGGMLIFHVFGAVAEFERELIRERTQAGLKSARARGRVGGRPRSLDAKKIEIAKTLHADGNTPVKAICEVLGGVSRATFYRCLKPPH